MIKTNGLIECVFGKVFNKIGDEGFVNFDEAKRKALKYILKPADYKNPSGRPRSLYHIVGDYSVGVT